MLEKIEMKIGDMLDRGVRWVDDGDGDYGVCFLGLFTLVKYKHSTLFKFGGRKYENAPKYLHGR